MRALVRVAVLAVALLVAPPGYSEELPSEADRPRLAVVLPVTGAASVGVDAESLDSLLEDSARDLGLSVAVPPEAIDPDEARLPSQAQELHRLVIVPSLRPRGARVEIRIIMASPTGVVLQSRVERAALEDVEVRAAVMLRDLVRSEPPRAPQEATAPASSPEPAATGGIAGRATLAVNGTLYGGLLGYSLQRASGSDDPRLLYPLLAVGAGVGLGSAIILADEFDITAGEAWYLAAGAWWPAVGGHLLYQGRFGDTSSASGDEAWAFGLVSSVTGVTLATVGLTGARDMEAGGAVFAHSGGAVGTILGGLTEFAISGDPEEVPLGGMGYGAIAGWLLGASSAVILRVDAGNVLVVDLGMLLGGMAGAAAASPLLIDDLSANKTRGWVAATGGGLVAGGVVAWWLAWDDGDENAEFASWRETVPAVGQIGLPPALGELAQPGWGLSWSGTLR